MKEKTLHLTLKKKWFDMILSGEKTEEYRDVKPYWARLANASLVYDTITFKNGYGKGKPTIVVELDSSFFAGKDFDTKGKEEWGADNSKNMFVLKLGRILSKTNCG